MGILNLSHAQKKLLQQRNIVLIDLSICEGIDGSHGKALEVFIDYLLSKKTRKNLSWPDRQSFYYRSDEDPASQIKSAIREWEFTRKRYPNWVVLPEDRRDVLWTYTEHNIRLIHNIDKVNAPYDIKLLYEFNWRIERCLYPILNNLISIYEKVLKRYNPFPGAMNIDDALDPQDQSLPWDEIEQKWLELHISVMRFYREEGFIEKWKSIDERLKMFNQLVIGFNSLKTIYQFIIN